MKRLVSIAFSMILSNCILLAECVPEAHLFCSVDSAPISEVFSLGVHTNNPTDTGEEVRVALWFEADGQRYYWPDGSPDPIVMGATADPGEQWDELWFVWLPPSPPPPLDIWMYWKSWTANQDGSIKQILEQREYHLVF